MVNYNKYFRCISGLFFVFVLFSCTQRIDGKLEALNDGSLQPSGIDIAYPLNGTVFPPEIPAPEFRWNGGLSGKTNYIISLATESGEVLLNSTVANSSWKPTPEEWDEIKAHCGHEKVNLTLIGKAGGLFSHKIVSGKSSFSISADSVGASVFYREVPLPFEYAVSHVDEIEWYIGSIGGEKPHKVLDHVPVCANCHSFTKDGAQIAMDVDYANDKGSYIIAPVEETVKMTFDKIITWSDFKREDGEKTFGLLSQISPDGRYVLSTVKDRSVFVPVDNLMYSQLFFPIKGILAYYDRQTKSYHSLRGADNPDIVQSNPNWSPDGNEVLFSGASRYYSAALENQDNIIANPEDVTEFINGEKDFKFNLYRVPFNNGAGGEPLPVIGASNNNLSNYFARYSPDGKWIVFCQAENFMLLQPDSKLYIMPAEGGEPRLMKCNTDNMNSWHSWSPNNRWLVFSSKAKGPYTQLYLTHIDEQGNDSPPVLLENFSLKDKAVNIPEFINDRNYKLAALVDSFSQSAFYYLSIARNHINNREFVSAFNSLEKSLQLDSTYFDSYMEKITLNVRLGQTNAISDKKDEEIAYNLINNQIRKNPDDASLLLKRANLEYYTERGEAALNDALKAVRLNPDNYDAYSLLALLYPQKGEFQKTLNTYQKLLEIKPGDKFATYHLALLFKEIKNISQANHLTDELIEKYPEEVRFYSLKADLLYLEGDKQGVKNIIDQAISQNPDSYEAYMKRGLFQESIGQNDLAEIDFKKSISLLTNQIVNNPEDLELLEFRSELYEKINSLNEALSDYENILAVMPLNYKILKRKAQIEYSRKQWQEAYETHTRLIENFKPQSDFYCNRCYTNIMLGNKGQATADLNKAQEVAKGNMFKLYDFAILEMNLDDYASAKRDLKKLDLYLSEKEKKGNLTPSDKKLKTQVAQQLFNLN